MCFDQSTTTSGGVHCIHRRHVKNKDPCRNNNFPRCGLNSRGCCMRCVSRALSFRRFEQCIRLSVCISFFCSPFSWGSAIRSYEKKLHRSHSHTYLTIDQPQKWSIRAKTCFHIVIIKACIFGCVAFFFQWRSASRIKVGLAVVFLYHFRPNVEQPPALCA